LRAAHRRTPAARLVEPEDVAGAVAYLCSSDAEMVRGHTLIIDGGYSLIA
jgi:enoyl-[acyl-carrier protein] reductase III